MVIASDNPYRTLHRYASDDMAGLQLPARVPRRAKWTNAPTNQIKQDTQEELTNVSWLVELAKLGPDYLRSTGINPFARRNQYVYV